MRYKNPTIFEIEEKRKQLIDCPEYHMGRKSAVLASLRAKDILLSFQMSKMNSEQKEFLKRDTKEVREGIKRIEEAWKYLQRSVPKISSDLTLKKIIEIGNIIDSDNDGLRRTSVTLNFHTYTPPNPQKVKEYLEKMLVEIKAEDLHSVERSALLHSRIVGIQPFSYGNKRLARLLQDKVLDENQLPPASIPLGERSFYLGLLEKALAFDRDGNPSGEAQFFHFISTKLNVALDILAEYLKSKNFCRNCLSYSSKTHKH